MKNLCLLIPSMKHGGAERAASRLSYILKESYNVSIVLFDGANITYETAVEPVTLNIPSKSNSIMYKIVNSTKRIISYRRYKKSNNIDITYSFGSTANIVNVLSYGKDKKIISFRGFRGLGLHNSLFNIIVMRPMIFLQSMLSDKIVLVSNQMKKSFNHKYGFYDKSCTIYNGYDIHEISKLANDDNFLDQEFIKAKDKGDLILITTGNYRIEKGYWHLLKIFSLVLNKRKDVSLFILGTGSEKEIEKMERLSKELAIEKKVHFVGYVSNVFAYYKKSDLYVLSSISEGFPNALVEAMACGLPVVSNNCLSGPEEILVAQLGKNNMSSLYDYGILCPRLSNIENWKSDEFDWEHIQMSDSILELLSDKNKRKEYSYRSKSRALDFNFAKWETNHIRLINDLFNERRD